MSRRIALDSFSVVLAMMLLAGAPLPAASAQDEPENQSASEQQEESGAKNEPAQQQQSNAPSSEDNPVQLKIIELKHVSYGDLRNMMRLHAADYFSGGPDEQVRVSHDGNSNTLFIRAPKQRLDTIEQFISRMDVPPGELPKEIEFGGGAVGKSVSPKVGERAMHILEQLGYPVSIQHFGGQRLLVIRSGEQAVRDEVTRVVERFAQVEQGEQQSQQQKQQESQPQEAGDPEGGSGEESAQ